MSITLLSNKDIRPPISAASENIWDAVLEIFWFPKTQITSNKIPPIIAVG